MRLILGISLGAYAWMLMGVQRLLGRPAGGWLSRRIGVAILRMYSLRGGIDDGASALFESWGEVGRQSLQSMLRLKQLRPAHETYARLLLGGEDLENMMRDLREAAARVRTVGRHE